MKIKISWLKELVNFKQNAAELAEIFSELGLEAEIIDEENILVEVTANRGDCLSMLGLARELSAKLNLSLDLPKVSVEESEIKTNFKVIFSDEAKKLVPRYTYRILKNIKIGPSPADWIKKLESYGFRSINNVVDATNLVMIELGQPMHAFDADKLNGSLNLRGSAAGEKILTLDGKEHTLKIGSLVGENNDGKLVDLCGIMGGFYSEVDEKTHNIVLQAAIFDSVSIRTTSKYLNHTTDASYRYERGVDQAQTSLALDRSSELILKTGGEAGRGVDLENQKIEERQIKVEYSKINDLLGINFTIAEINQNLEKLGFKILNSDNKNFSVQVPSFRLHDIYFAVDLAEEVLRLSGCDKLIPGNLADKKAKNNNYFNYKENLKDQLAQNGFSETLSYSFISRDDVGIFDLKKEELVKIKKPLSVEFEYFRSYLCINVLKQVARNPWFSEVKLFEIGRVADINQEEEKLVVMLAQKNGQAELEKIVEKLGLKVEIKEVSQKILDQFKIKKPVCYFEVKLNKEIKENCSYQILSFAKTKIPSNFPPSVIDLAFITNEKINASEIENFLNGQDNVILAELFDEFKSDKFGVNKKNLAYHLWLEKKDGALSEQEIRIIREQIIEAVNSKFITTLR
jgi:phenylalanyl-tRNA synthetase beta chain